MSYSYTYTVFCKMPDDKRGEYSEEIDITIKSRSLTRAKQVAQRLIDKDYDPNLRPVRVVSRGPGIWM